MPVVLRPLGNLVGNVRSDEARDDRKRHVDARRNATRGEDVAVLYPPRLRHPRHTRTLRDDPLPRAFVAGRSPSVEDAGPREQSRARANGCQYLDRAVLRDQEIEHLPVLHFLACADPARHQQHIELRTTLERDIDLGFRPLSARNDTRMLSNRHELELLRQHAEHLERAEDVEQLELVEEERTEFTPCHPSLSGSGAKTLAPCSSPPQRESGARGAARRARNRCADRRRAPRWPRRTPGS